MSEAPIVNTQESSIDTEDNSAKAPRWVPIVAKCTALACSLSWGFGSIWLFIRGLVAIRCIFAAVLMLFHAFVILCIEASVFLNGVQAAQPFIQLVSVIKMYQKSLYYIMAPTTILIMCSQAWLALSFGYLMSCAAGLTYGYGVLMHRKQTGRLC